MTLKIRIESDIHLEFDPNHTPIGLEDIDVYCLAGDVGIKDDGIIWAAKLIDKYPKLNIVYVSGNHCYYKRGQHGNYIEAIEDSIREVANKYGRLHYLQNESVVIDNVRFIGSTLWTSMNNGSPLEMYKALNGMTDYKVIRYNGGRSKFSPEYSMCLHKKSVEYIFNTLEQSKEKCIVVTHHKPYLSRRISGDLWASFESNLDDNFMTCSNLPLICMYGHTHESLDETIEYSKGSVRFISNQKGYPHEYNTGFNPNLVIEV